MTMRLEFLSILQVFESEVGGCRDIVGVADNLAPNAPALDLSDLYRYSLAGAVSALDTCMHSVVRVAILLQLQGLGPALQAQLPIPAELFRRWYGGDGIALNEIDLALRVAYSRTTMQSARDIADAVRVVSDLPLWITVAGGDANLAGYLKSSLDVVVQRRNKIAHESDLDPLAGTKWPIDSALAIAAVDLVRERGTQVIEHVASAFELPST